MSEAKKPDTTGHIGEWFQAAVPKPNYMRFRVQAGVHFEEVSEMLKALSSPNAPTQTLITLAQKVMHDLAKHLKEESSTALFAIDDVELLDALCDQIVTAVGVAHMRRYDIVGALQAVNKSNYSKFVDGKPIFDENGKIKKGPGYFKPDLRPYL